MGRFIKERQSLPAITLGCNLSSTTAIGNDYSFDDIFSRELSSIGQEGDVFIGITTSGNSPNVLKALDTALKKGCILLVLQAIKGYHYTEMHLC